MPIERPLDDVEAEPRPDVGGNPPVPHPRYVTKLADAWYQLYEDNGVEFASATDEWRASWSGGCARQVGYDIQLQRARLLAAEVDTTMPFEVNLAETLIASLQPTNPPTKADAWRFGLGTMVHEGLQDAIRMAWPTAHIEVKFHIDDINGGGHADVVVDEPVHVKGDDTPVQTFRTVIELKTINGFGFKTAATTFKGWPEGPRSSAVVQGAVNAEALGADRLVIGYLALELLSPDVAKRNGVDELGRFSAEWWYEKEEFLRIAQSERRRVAKIMSYLDSNQLAPRQIPDLPTGARVTDPRSGMWIVEDNGQVVDTGRTWHCGYCRNRDRCLEDGA